MVLGFFQEADKTRKVGGDFFAGFSDIHFELHVHGVRRGGGEIFVGIGGAEVAAVEIHAKPRVIHGLHKINEALGVADAVVVFDAKKNTVFGSVIAALAQALDGPSVGLVASDAFGFASGEHTNVRRAEHGGVVDPLFHVGNLRVARVAFGKGKIIAHSRAANFQAAQKCSPPQRNEIIARDRFLEKITGQLRAIAAVVGTEIDEARHIHRVLFHLARAGFLVAEKCAEGIRGQTQSQIGRARAFKRFRSEGRAGEGGGRWWRGNFDGRSPSDYSQPQLPKPSLQKSKSSDCGTWPTSKVLAIT